MLKVKNITKYFQKTKVLDDINLEILESQTLGLIGESGCGKSTLGNIIMRFITPTSGAIYFEDKNIFTSDLKLSRHIQMIFQDAYASLNPRLTVYEILAEPFLIHKIANMNKEIMILLDMVKLPKYTLDHFPHQFSGGQRQRIAIARALALRPKLIICDEPTSNLDVSIQAQILNLLIDLQKELKLTYLFISHDFAVVRYICQLLAVMERGKIVETGMCNDVFLNPKHPYTKNILEMGKL